MEKFSDFYNSKIACIEKAQAAHEHAKEFLAELFRVKKIIRKVYITFLKKCVESPKKSHSKCIFKIFTNIIFL